MTTREPVELLGLLADDTRLRAFAAVVLAAGSTGEVAARAGLSPRDAVRALSRLETGGLVSHERGGWSAQVEVLREVVTTAQPTGVPDDHGATDPAEAAVLRAFLRGGRLASIPAQRTKRLVVLDHVARVFEPGERYDEREVNALLRAFHPDHAALRRYLVDEGFLSREHGSYWRSGGTVEV